MLALIGALAVIVALLSVLVFGLLRSHADIVRSLHTLGVGVGDPGTPRPPEEHGTLPVHLRPTIPPLPAERSIAVHDLEGVSPTGDTLVVSMSSSPLNLVAFLSSGCLSCATLWESLADPEQRRLLPESTRVVVVTKGTEWESPAAIASKTPSDTTVLMSTKAWADYEVPGSPYFILVDGRRRERIGEGVGQGLWQIADMVRRAAADGRSPATKDAPTSGASRSRAAALGLNGAEREAHNDTALRGAGILPGDPSLYPKRLDDIFAAASLGKDRPENGPERA
jgi:hypothetical protein